ncbi:MAG: UDP-N-acetylglucosamine 2-epimerase (non-hydrolyzing) [Methanothrix sp.]|nr:UDP-N-acetylglucosamine 2-epimerase (non-hydrolyzing) [Methanothrix sp.]
MKIAIILGTRPEIIKMSPLIRICEKCNMDYFILHTGQHYSYNLDRVFFEDLELPNPKYILKDSSGTHAEETGRMLMGIERILKDEKADIALVEGDTNTVLAGALAASKLHIKIGHVEAGLRSNDRRMPEEINRILTDHASDYLFAPTDKAKENLLKEGIDARKIFVTGNTIVDAVLQNLEIANRKVNALKRLNLIKDGYFPITSHRQENVDDKNRLNKILDGLKLVSREFNLPVLFPIHPRTSKRLKEFSLDIPDEIRFTEPLGFLEFLQLEANAKAILTDSGGVQEESCILKVPCITLRENTERPETIDVGANILAGTDPNRILQSVRYMLNKERDWDNPFGNGKTAENIINILQEAMT